MTRPTAGPGTLPVMIAVASFMIGAGAARAQSCPGGDEPRVWLGISQFHCRGGTCVVGGASATMEPREARDEPPPHPEVGTRYDFSIEPGLWDIDEDGPAAGLLRGGDILVAVNGEPITTREAGRQLAAMTPQEPVELTVRREGRLVEARFSPERTCRSLRMSAGSSARPPNIGNEGARGAVSMRRSTPEADEERPSRSARDRPPTATTSLSYLGLELVGATELDVGTGGSVRWWFVEPPVVLRVRPESPAYRAGILPGSVLLEANGFAFGSLEATEALVDAEAAPVLRLRLRVGEDEKEVTVESGF